MKKILSALLIVAPLAFAQDSTVLPKDINNFSDLKDEVAELKNEIEALKKKIELCEFQGKLSEEITDRLPKTISLTPSTENFLVVNPGIGQITLSFGKLKAYASGTEFSVYAVNVASVPLTNVTFKVLVENSDKSWPFKPASMVSKNKGITLPSGKEVKILFRIPDVKPEDFKSIFISAQVGGISFKSAK